jgi:lipopolysaccharide/colanic/teichoic acid biosynthesis glycosyltransferase
VSTINSLELADLAGSDVGSPARNPGIVERSFPSVRAMPSVRHLVRCKPDGRTESTALDGDPELKLEQILHATLSRRTATLWVKRGIDVIGAAFGILLLFPLMLAVALAIRISSRGPILFSQMRYGLGGKPFRIYKFRTLYIDQADPTGQAQTVLNDCRITPLGRILRRSNIDELPQLWNVLIGGMSLVGPRPHPIGMKAAGIAYEDLIPAYKFRHLVKPGITGLAQVRGFRGTTIRTECARGRILNDLIYIQRISIPLDLAIIIATLLHELRHGTGI